MKAIVIGSSSGGPKALEQVLLSLPEKIKAIVIVIQHLPKQFTASMAKRLNEKSQIEIKEMVHQQKLEMGHCYIVPGGTDFLITSQPGKGVVSFPMTYLLPAKQIPSPCIDTGFTSVAEHFGPETIGVVLTGMGEDGMYGTKTVKQVGGHVIVQDEGTSAVYGMPKAVQLAGFADEVPPLEKIAKRLIELASK